MSNVADYDFIQEFLDQSFWNSTRGKASLLRHGVVPAETREALLTTELFELYLSSCQDLDDGWVRVIRDGLGRSPRARTKDHHLDLKAVRAAHRDGASLLLTRLQKRRKEVALCCRGFEEAFVRQGVVLTNRVGANAYLTPPESSGFKVHNDGHDVVVLQLEGKKHWSLYDFAPTLPLEGGAALLEDPPEPSEELVLGPGDLLYVPRGLFHAAETRETHSLHITLSVHVLTRRELVQRALDRIDSLRQDAPLFSAERSLAPEVAHEVSREVTAALQPDHLAEITDEIRRESIADWEIVPDTHLRSAWRSVQLGNGDLYRRAAGVFGILSQPREDLVELVCPGGKIRGASALREPLEYVLESEGPYAAEDLPGPLTGEAKLALLRALVDSGLATVVNDQDPG